MEQTAAPWFLSSYTVRSVFRRFVGSIPGLSPDGSVWLTSRSQPYSYSRDQVIEMMEFLIECGPPRLPWEPVEVFYKLSCVPLMLQLVSAACDWKTYYGR